MAWLVYRLPDGVGGGGGREDLGGVAQLVRAAES